MITGLSYKNLEDGKDNSNQMSQNPIQLELQKEQICCNIFFVFSFDYSSFFFFSLQQGSNIDFINISKPRLP